MLRAEDDPSAPLRAAGAARRRLSGNGSRKFRARALRIPPPAAATDGSQNRRVFLLHKRLPSICAERAALSKDRDHLIAFEWKSKSGTDHSMTSTPSARYRILMISPAARRCARARARFPRCPSPAREKDCKVARDAAAQVAIQVFGVPLDQLPRRTSTTPPPMAPPEARDWRFVLIHASSAPRLPLR